MQTNELSDLKPVNPLGYESISKLVLRYAVPGVIGMVINSIYNIVDQIFIGRGVGYLGNTATTVSFPFTTLAMAISLMLAHGNSAYMSLRLGEENREDAARSFGNTLAVALTAGVSMMLLSLLFLDQLLTVFGATEASMSFSRDYAGIIVLGFPFIMVTQMMNNATRTDGSPRYAMWTMSSGAILNTILDPIFIFVFHWGVKGAAVATVIGQVLSFVIALLYLGKFKSIQLKRSYITLKAKYLPKVLSLGTSDFITQFSSVFMQVALANTLKKWGASSVYGSEIPIAAIGITMKINMILFGVLIGISNAQQPIIGFNYGARKFARVKKTYLVSAAAATAAGFIGWSVFQLFPMQIISLFGQENALYNEFAVKCLRTFLSLIFVAGFNVTSSAMFQAIGKPLFSVLLTLLRQVMILIPLIVILPHFFGLEGVLYSMPITDIIMVSITAIVVIRQMKKLDRYTVLAALE